MCARLPAELPFNGLGTPPPPPILLCDVNGDGRINNKDIAPLKKILAGKAPPVPMADCNGDGVIDAGDLLDLQDLVGVTKPRKGPLPLQINPFQALAVDSQPLPAGIQVVGVSGSLLTNLLDWIVFTNAFTKTLADPDLITTYSDNKFEGEYQANGQAVQEVFWLGDLPVAVLQSNGNKPTNASLYSIDADHLNTPRQLQDPSGTVVWSWSSAHFGALPANEDPDGDGKKVSFNLRFPGQYYDAETGLHYNYFRDYSPQTGRYQQSDPIGLAGGINTFGYVGGNPLSGVDPLGLFNPFDVTDYPTIPQPVVDGVAGFGDAFLIPILVRNALGSQGSVNRCSKAYAGGMITGTIWGIIPFGLEEAAAFGATKAGHLLNHNRYFRIGPGRSGGVMVPRISSPFLPRNDGHELLTSSLPKLPPVGGLLSGENCGCQ